MDGKYGRHVRREIQLEGSSHDREIKIVRAEIIHLEFRTQQARNKVSRRKQRRPLEVIEFVRLKKAVICLIVQNNEDDCDGKPGKNKPEAARADPETFQWNHYNRINARLFQKPVPKAVCLLSGGLDSATCLAFARREGFDCYALSFDYGQRHRVELEAARRVAAHFAPASTAS